MKTLVGIIMLAIATAAFGGITKHQPKKEEPKRADGSKGLDSSKGLGKKK